MARLGNYSVGFAGFVLLTIMGVPGNADDNDGRPRRPLKVEIVSPLPLPVTGTLGFSGTANVNVTNTPNVNVTNIRSAQIVNTADAPIPVRDTHITSSFTLSIGAGEASKEASPAVPPAPPEQTF